MQTFTEREMGEPAAVLDACDRDGEARILRGDGRLYRLAPANEPARAIRSVPDFIGRTNKLFPDGPIPAAQVEMVDSIIRGDHDPI